MDRILVGGFSQGAAIALFAGLTHHLRLAGVVALSGYLLQHHRFPAECQANRETPLFFGCGDADDLVPFESLMKRSADRLQDFQEGVQLHVYKNLGHTVNFQV